MPDPVSFFVDRLAEGIATIAAAFAPEPVIVRLSDFKSNEYANLIGGSRYEPHEENPMLGFRGASRYVEPSFRPCFELECRALRKVREDMGLTNVQVMVPFVRTVDEARQVTELLADNGLERGKHGLKLIMMCEMPSNALLADAVPGVFRRHVDRLQRPDAADAGSGPGLGHHRRRCLTSGMTRSRRCCRWPSRPVATAASTSASAVRDRRIIPDFARWLLDQGIESMSLNPDTVVETWMYLAGKEV